VKTIKSYYQVIKKDNGQYICEWIAVGSSILNKTYRFSSETRESAIKQVQACIDKDYVLWNGQDRRINRQL